MTLCAREAYRAELALLADDDERIVAIEADLGGANHPFAEAHPHRFVNVGIAEAAAVDIAVGLASAGLRPFVSTFATFAAFRAAESVKLGLGYLGAAVVLACPYGGASGAWFGPTHQALDDIAVMASLPGIRIAVPCGEAETRAVIAEAAAGNAPCYIRLGRNEVFDAPFAPAGPGDVAWVNPPGTDATCLVSIGEKPAELCVAATAARPGLGHAHLCWVDAISLAAGLSHLAGAARRLVVVEEHRAAGSVASSLALMLPGHEIVSVNAGTTWLSSGGSHDDVLAAIGLTTEAVLDAVGPPSVLLEATP